MPARQNQSWKNGGSLNHHYSDEELVSHLDGELSKHERKRIGQHLAFCWACRTRQAELEKQIHAVSASMRKFEVNADWQQRTQRKIALFQAQFEKDFQPDRRFAFFTPKLWIGVAVAVCAAMLTVFPRQPAAPSPVVLLQAVNLTATQLATEPVHQVFEVNEVQVQPAGPARKSRLELWSDGKSSRFASKWIGANGHLKHAIWSSSGKASFVYGGKTLRPLLPGAHTQAAAAFTAAEPDLDSLEIQFMHWLEERPWKPIVLLADLSIWQGNGSVLRVERVSGRQLRLTVMRRQGGVKLQLIAVVDAQGSAPHMQTMRLEGGGRVVEFQLASERSDTQPVFSEAVFHPDRSFLLLESARAKAARAPLPIERLDRPLAMGDVDLLVRAMQAHYILHLAGACKGTPVTVAQEPGGVRVSASETQPSYFTKDVPLEDVMEALAETRARQPQFHGDASALAILAAAFDETKVRALPPSSLRLFRRMVEDHAAGLRETLAKLNGTSAAPLSTAKNPVPQIQNWWSAISIIAENATSLDSQSLQQVAHTADELFQKTIETDQRMARVREFKKEIESK